MTARLHLPVALRAGDEIELAPEQSHYVARVLRLRPGEALQIFDGLGSRHAAVIVDPHAKRARLRVGDAQPALADSPLSVTLGQCISSAEKMDWTIEKAVELGVATIQPLISKRTVVRLDAQRAQRRGEHWQRLIVAACMQCGRDRLPSLAPPIELAAWLAAGDAGTTAVVLVPGARIRLAGIETRGASLKLLVGPESGLADEELEAARAAGFVEASLGPRVLRTETAGLAALAVLQAKAGDL
jgi:16S rRNA (uracil1498-N3)-methyltransferase